MIDIPKITRPPKEMIAALKAHPKAWYQANKMNPSRVATEDVLAKAEPRAKPDPHLTRRAIEALSRETQGIAEKAGVTLRAASVGDADTRCVLARKTLEKNRQRIAECACS